MRGLDCLSDDDLYAVADFFKISEPIVDRALEAKNIGHVDVVLALFHLGRRSAVEALIGKKIQVLKGFTHVIPLPITKSREPRVTRVSKNPRLPTTPSWGRFRQIRPGLTITQLLVRGVTRRDITEAQRNGWVELG